MKNPSAIFSHLFSNNKHKFFTQKCLHKLKTLLPKRFGEHLHYSYVKNRTLYFVFDHPAFVMEFNYSKKDINALLKLLREKSGYCRDLDVITIKAYHKFIPTTQEQIPSVLRYTERAKGDFAVHTDNPKIQELMHKIREAIRRNATS